jgi:glycosyltransferase involved in cell wall biosynthesis
METRLKLAFFSPLNPIQSGISDYSEELLPYLARYADIDLYVDDYTPANQEITRQFAVYPASKFSRQAGRYDTYLFHMGNSAAHAYIYRALQATAGQGILVLHDFVLHHFLIGEYLNHGKAPEYIRQMARRYGAEGEKLAREVIKGRFAESLFYYPLNETAIEAGRAVLVHSQYARHLIEKAYPDKPVGVARMGVPLPPLVSKAEARARLGLPEDEFVLFSLGHLNPYKRLDSALWAYRAFSREFPNSRFVLAGSLSPNYNVRAMIEALGLTERVELPGYTSPEQSRDYLAAADVCLNLRYPTAGETSASLLRIMGAGRAVLVSRTGAFEELPDDSCIKVDVDDAEEELLLEYLRLLARRPEVKQALGRNARRYVTDSARLVDAAHDYYLFLCQILGRAPVIQPAPAPPEVELDELDLPSELKQTEPEIPRPTSAVATSATLSAPAFDELAQAAADIGLDENDPALAEIVRAARFTGLI